MTTARIYGPTKNAMRSNIERNFLALVKDLHPSALDFSDMHEYVFAAVIGLDEAVAFVGIEPFHRALHDVAFPQKRGSPAISRDYQSDSTTTIALLPCCGRKLDHVCGGRHVQRRIGIPEEPSEHMTPRRIADRDVSAPETLGILTAEVTQHQAPAVMGQYWPLNDPPPVG
jgi:hypothetical protein